MKKSAIICLFVTGLFSTFSVFSQQAGTLDSGFGNDGIVLEAYGSDNAAVLYNSILLPDGKILAAGKAYTPPDFIEKGCLARFLPDGSLDNTFGANGWQVYDLNNDMSYFTSLAVQPDGKYIVAGYAHEGSSAGFVACRIQPDGTLDNSFGTGGFTVIDAGNTPIAQSVTLQPDGKIVLAGSVIVQKGSNQDAVVCRLNTDGTLDNTFSDDGISIVDLHGNSLDIVRGLAIHTGNILISGIALNGNGTDYDALALVQFKPDGELDPMFGVGGISIIDDVNQEGDTYNEPTTNLVVAPDDKIFVATHITGIEGDDVVLFKFLSNGYPDNDFGEYGMALYDMIGDNYSNSLALQSDGKIIVSGTHYLSSGSEFLIMRFLENGDIDNSFGEYYGVSLISLPGSGFDVAMSVNIQNDSKILVSGYSNSDNLYFALIRLYSGLETSVETKNISNSEALLYPNPVKGREFRIDYNLPQRVKLNISLLNSDGEVIAQLLEAERNEGAHTEVLQLPENLPSGIYIINATAGREQVFRKRLTILKTL